jgi:hypothetical protein
VRNEASLVRHLKRLACALALWLAACGGGDGGIDGGGGLSCSIGDQQVWLRDNFDRNYSGMP